MCESTTTTTTTTAGALIVPQNDRRPYHCRISFPLKFFSASGAGSLADTTRRQCMSGVFSSELDDNGAHWMADKVKGGGGEEKGAGPVNHVLI